MIHIESCTSKLNSKYILNAGLYNAGDGRQGKWEATGHIVKLQEASEEVTMELRDSSKLPTDTTTGQPLHPESCAHGTLAHVRTCKA